MFSRIRSDVLKDLHLPAGHAITLPTWREITGMEKAAKGRVRCYSMTSVPDERLTVS